MHTLLGMELKPNIGSLESLTSFFVSLFTSVCRRVPLATAVTAAGAVAASPAFYQDAAIDLQGRRGA